MNILPLVMAFAVMMALAAYQIAHDFSAYSSEQWCASSFMRARRQLATNLEKKRYRASKGKTTYRAHRHNSGTSGTLHYHNPRDAISLHPLSRLNIFTLLASGGQDKRLYEIAARFLALVYGKSAIYTDGLEYKIVDTLIAAYGDKGTFEDLAMRALEKEPSLYKVFKGTKNYDFSGKGYPPLSNLLTIIENKESKAVYFYYAQTPLVRAIFGDKVAAAIAEEEQKKWEKDKRRHSLGAKEIALLLGKEPRELSIAALQVWINFTKKAIANPVTAVSDPQTQLLVTTK